MQIDDEYFRSKEFHELLSEYEAAMKAGEPPFMDVDDLTDIIDYYNFHKDIKHANEAANLAMAIYPGAAGPLMFKARWALDNDDLTEAKRLTERISDKTLFDYSYMLAEIEIAQNHLKEAEKILRDSLKREKDEKGKEYIRLDAAELFLDYGVDDLADKWLETCRDKDSIDYLDLRSRCSFLLHDTEDAIDCLMELLDKDPYRYSSWNMLSSLQSDKHEFPEAVTSSEYSLAIAPDNPEGLVCQVRGLLGLGNIEKAMRKARSAVDTNRDERGIYTKLMILMLQKSLPSEAYKFFSYCVKHTMPKDLWEGYAYMAVACGMLGKLNEFETYLKQAVIHNPEEVERAFRSVIPPNLHRDEYFHYLVNYVRSNFQ